MTTQLTAREQQVIALTAEGLTSREIAERMSITESGIKKHLLSICGKLGAVNKPHAVAIAAHTGILSDST